MRRKQFIKKWGQDEGFYKFIVQYMKEVEPILVFATLSLILASYPPAIKVGASRAFWISTVGFAVCIFLGYLENYKLFRWTFVIGLSFFVTGIIFMVF